MNEPELPKVNPEDFTEAEHAMVDSMAAQIIKDHKGSKHFNKRNRKAWKRMNRPEKLDKMDRGSEEFIRLLTKGEKLSEGVIGIPTSPGVATPTNEGVDNGFTGV